VRASTAAIVYVDIARATSTRAALSGFPASALIRRVGAAPERSRDADEDLGALVGGQRALHRALSRINSATGLLVAAAGDAPDEPAVVRRADLEPFVGLDPHAVDEKPAFQRRRRHDLSLRDGAA
jgi:hypothetical protein